MNMPYPMKLIPASSKIDLTTCTKGPCHEKTYRMDHEQFVVVIGGRSNCSR